MKNYIRPSVEVSKFDVADIITASGLVADVNSFAPGSVEKTLYQAYQDEGGAQTQAAVFQW